MTMQEETNKSANAEGEADDIERRTREVVRTVALELRPGLRTVAVDLDTALDRDLGFDSLSRTELIARIEKVFGVNLPDAVFATAESPRDIMRAIREAGAHLPTGAIPVTTVLPTAGEAAVTGAPATAETLVDVLKWHEGAHPDRIHIQFFDDDGDGETLSYGALAAAARRIAAGLQAHDIGTGDAVAMMLPSGKDYFAVFTGALLIGAVAVPMYPPTRLSRIEDHVRRHLGILGNCQARALITTADIQPVAQVMRAHIETLSVVLTPEEVVEGAAESYLAPAVSSQDLALLQYTSGSTGDPKGVMLTHGNLIANIRAMTAAIEATPEDVFVSWLPLYHDMGLIGAWLGSLYQATTLVLLSPLQFLARPSRWLRAIHRYGGTISGGPNFAFELCLRRVSDSDIAGLDLGSWRVAFNGAEPVSAETLERFCARFAPCGFRREAMMPVYGLAEDSVGLAFPTLGRGPLIDPVRRTVFQNTGEALPVSGDEAALRFVASGRPLSGHEIRVVDTAGRELPERREGRVQFRGPSATQGYFRNPGATKRLFDGDWLETGDMGYMAGGDIHITGRQKDLIIRAGRNIHPADIEAAVGAVDGVIAGNIAVFGSRDTASGTERLVVLAETRKTDEKALDAIRARINALVADHTDQPADDIVLAPPNTVPKTSSGKVRRAASREIFEAGLIGKQRDAPWRQLLRLRSAAVLARTHRFGRNMLARLYAGYTWTLVGIAAPILWPALVVVPGSRRRWRMARAVTRFLLWCAGIGIDVRDEHNVPADDQVCVFAGNHMSYLDGFALMAVLPRPVVFTAKAELARSPWTRIPLSRIGVVFVERFDNRRGLENFRDVTAHARAGRSPFFFAEGTLRRMPGLLPFHMGAFATAGSEGLPVVPVAIRGTRNILRDGSWFPRRGRITVILVNLFIPIWKAKTGDVRSGCATRFAPPSSPTAASPT